MTGRLKSNAAEEQGAFGKTELGAVTISREGLLIFVSAGMMSVNVDGCLWALAPHRALWLPPGTAYTRYFRKERVEVYPVPLDKIAELPAMPRMVEVTPLLRELVLEAVRLAKSGRSAAEGAWIERLLISRINAAPVQTSRVVTPIDSRLRQICDAIIGDPSDNRTIDYWAKEIGMSRRSLTRRFREEIGTSFSMWRQQVRLVEALVRLEMGESVTAVALDVGYEWSTSLSTVFRQTFGAPPSRFAGSV